MNKEVNFMLSFSKIFSQGLIGASTGDGHALVAVPAAQIEENVEKLDMSNYKKVHHNVFQLIIVNLYFYRKRIPVASSSSTERTFLFVLFSG